MSRTADNIQLAAQEAKLALAATFTSYRQGWEQLWQQQGAHANRDQIAEVRQLLHEEETSQLKIIDTFAEYAIKGGQIDNMFICVDAQRSFFDEPPVNSETIGTLPVTGAMNALPAMVELHELFDTVIHTMDTQLRHGDPTFNSTFGGSDASIGEATIEFQGKQYTNRVWPNHCVHGTKGFNNPDLLINAQKKNKLCLTIDKGGFSGVECYSAIENQAGQKTVLHALLKMVQPKQLVFAGLTLDYCVQSTINHVLDMCERGELLGQPQLILIRDATAAVFPDDGEKHIASLKKRGVLIMPLKEYRSITRPSA